MTTKAPNHIDYEYKTITVNSGTTDYDVKNSGLMFTNFTNYGYVRITTTADISVKVNFDTNEAIEMTRSENGNLVFGPSDTPIRPIQNLYITNSGANNASVGILLCDSKTAFTRS